MEVGECGFFVSGHQRIIESDASGDGGALVLLGVFRGVDPREGPLGDLFLSLGLGVFVECGGIGTGVGIEEKRANDLGPSFAGVDIDFRAAVMGGAPVVEDAGGGDWVGIAVAEEFGFSGSAGHVFLAGVDDVEANLLGGGGPSEGGVFGLDGGVDVFVFTFFLGFGIGFVVLCSRGKPVEVGVEFGAEAGLGDGGGGIVGGVGEDAVGVGAGVPAGEREAEFNIGDEVTAGLGPRTGAHAAAIGDAFDGDFGAIAVVCRGVDGDGAGGRDGRISGAHGVVGPEAILVIGHIAIEAGDGGAGMVFDEVRLAVGGEIGGEHLGAVIAIGDEVAGSLGDHDLDGAVVEGVGLVILGECDIGAGGEGGERGGGENGERQESGFAKHNVSLSLAKRFVLRQWFHLAESSSSRRR